MGMIKVIIFFVLGYWLVKSLAKYFGGEVFPKNNSSEKSSKNVDDNSRKSSLDIQDAEYEEID